MNNPPPFLKKSISIHASPFSFCSISLPFQSVFLESSLSSLPHCLPSHRATSFTSQRELPPVMPSMAPFPRAAGHSYCLSFLTLLAMRPIFCSLLPRTLSSLASKTKDFTYLSSLSSQCASRPVSSCPSQRSWCPLLFLSCSTWSFMQAFTHLLISPKPRPWIHNSLIFSRHWFQPLEGHLLLKSQSPQSQSFWLYWFLSLCLSE